MIRSCSVWDFINLQSFDCKNKIIQFPNTGSNKPFEENWPHAAPQAALLPSVDCRSESFIRRCGAKPRAADRFHSRSDIRYVAAVHRAAGLVRLAARVCPAVFLHVYRGLLGATKGQLEPLPRPHTSSHPPPTQAVPSLFSHRANPLSAVFLS